MAGFPRGSNRARTSVWSLMYENLPSQAVGMTRIELYNGTRRTTVVRIPFRLLHAPLYAYAHCSAFLIARLLLYFIFIIPLHSA
uniref:Uncharacterized protein n=1 Tax=Anguilla anguilla TaxID=7936 RepID=A0A0E9RLQ4_ANGAN